MREVKRVGIVGGVRIPFARVNTHYAHSSNFDMLTATLKSLTERFGLTGKALEKRRSRRQAHARFQSDARCRLGVRARSRDAGL